ncbi:hypothetical protein C6Q21_06485 [Burkholderia multivorans]|nr:hypothetical protein C6Q21_06485 [Burkholderia multivorans]PRH03137.1 hypothetical protein C6T60_18745 [Burkholderia multivorans]PRH28647.1 hypothetical protein C6T53_10335 [Burkholderia multivorans]
MPFKWNIEWKPILGKRNRQKNACRLFNGGHSKRIARNRKMKAAERRAPAWPRTTCVGGIFYVLRA